MLRILMVRLEEPVQVAEDAMAQADCLLVQAVRPSITCIRWLLAIHTQSNNIWPPPTFLIPRIQASPRPETCLLQIMGPLSHYRPTRTLRTAQTLVLEPDSLQ